MLRIRLILSFLVLSVLFSCNNTNSVSQENKLNSDQKIENPDEKETSQKENKKITIIGVGDIMLGSNYPSKNLLPKNDYNILSDTEKILQDADITIGNLEGTLFDEGGIPKSCSDPSVCFVFRTPSKYGQYLKKAGFDQVILDQGGVLQTDEEFTKILDLVGPRDIKDSLKHLLEGGIICSCGQLGGQWTLSDFDPIEALCRNVYLTTFASANVSNEKLQELIDFVEKYQIDVQPEKIFAIDQIQEAHAYLESSQSFGKVIIKNEGNL